MDYRDRLNDEQVRRAVRLVDELLEAGVSERDIADEMHAAVQGLPALEWMQQPNWMYAMQVARLVGGIADERQARRIALQEIAGSRALLKLAALERLAAEVKADARRKPATSIRLKAGRQEHGVAGESVSDNCPSQNLGANLPVSNRKWAAAAERKLTGKAVGR